MTRRAATWRPTTQKIENFTSKETVPATQNSAAACCGNKGGHVAAPNKIVQARYGVAELAHQHLTKWQMAASCSLPGPRSTILIIGYRETCRRTRTKSGICQTSCRCMHGPQQYHEAAIYPGDPELFSEGQWLNDRCINAYYRYLEHDVFRDCPEVLFMDPAVVACMMLQCADIDELKSFGQGLQICSKRHVFIPLNDCKELVVGGGSHWSLLYFNVEQACCAHYDSHDNHNGAVAHHAAPKLSVLSGQRGTLEIKHIQAPQQRNGSDCGMYVLMMTEQIARIVSDGGEAMEDGLHSRLSQVIRPSTVKRERKRIQDWLNALMQSSNLDR